MLLNFKLTNLLNFCCFKHSQIVQMQSISINAYDLIVIMIGLMFYISNYNVTKIKYISILLDTSNSSLGTHIMELFLEDIDDFLSPRRRGLGLWNAVPREQVCFLMLIILSQIYNNIYNINLL